MTLAWVGGIFLLVDGVFELVVSLSARAEGRGERHRLGDLVVAVLEVIAGVIIVAAPGIGVAALALILGIAFVLRGLGMTMLARPRRGVQGL